MVSTSKPTVKAKPTSAAKERKRRSRKVAVEEIDSDGSAVTKSRGLEKGEREASRPYRLRLQVTLQDMHAVPVHGSVDPKLVKARILMANSRQNHVICDYDGTAEANEYEIDDNKIAVDGSVQSPEEDEDLADSEYEDTEGTASKTVEEACKAAKKAHKAARKAHKAAKKAYKAAEKCQMASRKA